MVSRCIGELCGMKFSPIIDEKKKDNVALKEKLLTNDKSNE